MEASSFDLVAAALRADASDVQVFVETLAGKLSRSFPGRVEVGRPRSLLGRARPVRRLAVTLGDSRYELEHAAGQVTCFRRTLVRGIAIRNDELDLDAWIEELTRSLVAESASTAQGRAALAELLE